MTPKKLVLVMAVMIVLMTAFAYFTLDIPNSKAGTFVLDYTVNYMIGFVTPLVGSATVLLAACRIILGRKQKIIRVNHQNQAV